VNHLALAVADQERSRRFYETLFGFDARPADTYSDGTLMLHNAEGFDLALGRVDEPIRLPPFFHFGMGVSSPDEVRALRERLIAWGIAIVEEWEEPQYVSVKCRDPDGYVVEVFWEPAQGS
jgi:catechol 2,3-dioxygenase-like lactoylglutathione lyase family enzyme